MNDKFIPILTVISHHIVFLHQSEWKDFGYPIWFVPDMILVSREVANIVLVCYSCIYVDT